MGQERIDDVVVVGGGIIGCAIAREAARAGLRVRLLEKSVIGGEASGAAAGLLSPQAEADRLDPLFQLCLASRDLFPDFARQVAEESGLDPALSERGTLVVARRGAEAESLDRRAFFQRSLGLAAERLGGEALRRMEPALHPDWSEGLYLPRDFTVDNILLVRALALAAARLGARLLSGARAERLVVESGRVVGVESGGERVRGGAVVVAAGAWSAEIAGPGVGPLPSHPVRGQIVCFGPSPVPAHPLFTHDCYLVPRRDGRVLAGSTMERAGFDKSVTGSGLAGLSASALALVPALSDAPFHSAWAGLRPATPDELPAIGRARTPGLLYACGHLRNGILLAPLTARVVTRLLADEDPGMDLSPFDPSRFPG
jgi:glycine oxidase